MHENTKQENVRKVVIHIEGGVVHDLICPNGVEVHIINSETDELFDADLCPGCPNCDQEHQHIVWSHMGGKTICAAYVQPDKTEQWSAAIEQDRQTHTSRLAGITAAIADGSYEQGDSFAAKVCVTADRLAEVMKGGAR